MQYHVTWIQQYCRYKGGERGYQHEFRNFDQHVMNNPGLRGALPPLLLPKGNPDLSSFRKEPRHLQDVLSFFTDKDRFSSASFSREFWFFFICWKEAWKRAVNTPTINPNTVATTTISARLERIACRAQLRDRGPE